MGLIVFFLASLPTCNLSEIRNLYYLNHKVKSFLHMSFNIQDLKDDTLKAEMGAARSILEKSTMMLLTTSKVMFETSFLFCVTI